MSKRKKGGKINRASLGKANRNKGNNAERHYAQFFRDFGFPFCKTTRAANRLLDSCGVDLAFLPVNIQIKAGAHRGLNYAATLKYTEDRLKENYPPTSPEHDMPKILLRKHDIGRGKRKTEYHETITMTLDDFIKLIKMIENNDFKRNKKG